MEKELKTETFKKGNVIVNVHYIEKLNKEKLESICKEYMARVERNRKHGKQIR